MTKPRDGQGKIITNISDRQIIADVTKHLTDWDTSQWRCWRCKGIYNVEPRPGEFTNCPKCGADPVPF